MISLNQEQTIRSLSDNLLHSLKRSSDNGALSEEDQRWNQKIKTLLGQGSSAEASPMLLVASPGQGKLSMFKMAAEKVAQDMGLNLLLNPDESIPVTRQDLVLHIQEMGVTGLSLSNEDNILTRAIDDLNRNRRHASAAAGNMVVFDDLTQCSVEVQSELGLALIENPLPNTYISATSMRQNEINLAPELKGWMKVVELQVQPRMNMNLLEELSSSLRSDFKPEDTKKVDAPRGKGL